jgi:hypothetical protein
MLKLKKITNLKSMVGYSFYVPGAGLEPAWTEARWILSPVRLPVSPPRQWY